MVVVSSIGSPAINVSAIACLNFAINLSTRWASMIKRFEAIQLCPIFKKRPCTAPATTKSIFALSKTIKASEPPSSNTNFFSSEPAIDATFLPAASLPVRLTAFITGFLITDST